MSTENPALVVDAASLPSGNNRSTADRILSIFADVHAGEGIGALLLAGNLFLLLGSYYILKTIREALILSEGGAEIKAYSSALQAVLLLMVIPAYGALASKVNRERLIALVTVFFASHLVLFYLVAKSGTRVGIAFFLWVGIFNLFVISQFWGFANDLYNKAQGKRLLPVVGIGSSLGAWVGSVYAGRLLPIFGTYGLMLLAGGLLLACVGVNRLVPQLLGAFCKQGHPAGKEPLGKEGAFRLILSSRYLMWIAALMIIVNIVNTTGEFVLSKLVVENANRLIAAGQALPEQRAEIIGAFYGSFFSWVNLSGMLLQLFVVSRILKYVGVRGALLVLPLIALASYGLVAALPVLSLVRTAKVMENSSDYSIQNTARQALFLPTSREAKYKAKAAIDSFFWRLGDLLSAGLVFIGIHFGFGIQHFAVVNIALALGWIAIVAIIGREHRKLSPAG